MTNQDHTMPQDLDIQLNQQAELAPESNPLRTSLEAEHQEVDKSSLPTKKKDKKIILLIALVALLFVLLVTSSIATSVARSRQSQVTAPTPILATPTPAPVINPVALPASWSSQLEPIKQDIQKIDQSLNSEELLPPNFDLEIGL